MAVDAVTAGATLIGVLLGGGIRAVGALAARNYERRAVLSAVVAEVDALARVARFRGYLPQFTAARDQFRQIVDSGHGAEMGSLGALQVSGDYFAVFDALRPKLGLLSPTHSALIIRFYVLAKTMLENCRPDSQWVAQKHAYSDLLEVLENDVVLMESTLRVADQIVQFVPAKDRPGVVP